MGTKKIISLTKQPSPYRWESRAHAKLNVMVQARYVDGTVKRRFFQDNEKANVWVSKLFAENKVVTQ